MHSELRVKRESTPPTQRRPVADEHYFPGGAGRRELPSAEPAGLGLFVGIASIGWSTGT